MSLKVLLGLCLVATLSLESSGERVRYDNYRVYKVIASSPEELAVLKNLEGVSDSIRFLDGVHIVGKNVDVIVAPHKVPDFLTLMGRNDIEYELKEIDLQKMFDAGDVQVTSTSERAYPYDWTQYFQLDDTYRWMQSLVSDFPSIVTLIEAGKSYERRSILGLKISHRTGQAQKPGIFLEAGIHAREWISPATATYIIQQLLTSNVPSVMEIAQSYDWYIIPHANPDGYVYTHTTDRAWRKTRTPYGNCYGADPNRNWDLHWNEVGASSNPCSDTYAGPSAFSEIETLSLSNFIASKKGLIQMYVSFHSYSQLLLYPYGYTGQLPDNIDHFQQVYDATLDALSKRYGTTYTGGNIYDAIYPAAGSSVDWAFDTVGARMAFCYELRPSASNGGVGFQLPASEIIATGEETLDSMVAMVNKVKELGYFNIN